MNKAALMSSAALLLFASCSKPEIAPLAKKKEDQQVKLQGQTFVIQKNRMNVKLGGVRISFVPLEKVRERCSWIAENRQKASLITAYQQRLNQIDRWLKTSSKQSQTPGVDEFLKASSRIQTSNWGKFRGNPSVGTYCRLNELQDENGDIFGASEFKGAPDQQWSLAALFFEWLQQAELSSAESDADGLFEVSLGDAERGYLFAQTSRQISGGDFEHYFWMEEVKGEKESKRVQLTSNNTVTPASLEELLRQSAEKSRVSMKLVVDEFGLGDLDWFRDAESLMRDVAANQSRIESLGEQVRALEFKVKETEVLTEP